MKKILSILVYAVSLLAHAEGNIQKGQQKAQVCTACHGPQGNQTINPEWPNLGGQDPEYLVAQMQAFKKGEKGSRYNAVMSPLMANLPQEDMQDIAAFYASQPRVHGKASPEHFKLGAQLYRGGSLEHHIPACSACHSPKGDGNPEANFPALAGQHSAYTAMQLNHFKNKTRQTDYQQIMQGIAQKMTSKDMEAVADYIQGLY